MSQDTNVNASREQLIDDFNKVVADTEALLRTMAGVTGEKAIALRASVEENLRATKARLRELQSAAAEKTTAAARATDEYVRENPWTAVGVAAVAGLVIGMLISGRR